VAGGMCESDYVRACAGFANFEGGIAASIAVLCHSDHAFMHAMHVSVVTLSSGPVAAPEVAGNSARSG
jgi:hypothetical protein